MSGFFHESEREQLRRFPVDISFDDIAGFFTLLPSDIQFIKNRSGEPNRLGLALQIGALRYLGFIPEDINVYPEPVVRFVSQQIAVKPVSIAKYADRSQTRTEHIKEIETHLGFRRPYKKGYQPHSCQNLRFEVQRYNNSIAC